MHKVLLSVLIPVYKYYDGVVWFLDELGEVPNDCEIIIHDIGQSNICSKISPFVKNKNIKISSVKKGLCPADNWNNLIMQANGKYINLVHHDEVPPDNYLKDLSSLLKYEHSDLYILNVDIYRENKTFMRKHSNNFLKRLILNQPDYLFKRNLSGPSAAIIFRNNGKVKFSRSLKWLVDVDFYYKLIMITDRKKISLFSNLTIRSIKRKKNSITEMLRRSDIKFIEQQELQEIKKDKMLEKSRWVNKGGSTSLIYYFETLFFLLTRFYLMIISSLKK